MSGDNFDLARLHMQAAEKALQSAKALADLEDWRGCANRTYYACFYAAVGLHGGRAIARG